MKKIFFVFIAVIFILSSCEEPVLLSPYVPSDENRNSETAGKAPDGVSASQGDKRSITVSWNPLSDAAYYLIYRAGSPLDVFVRCGETSQNQFTFNVPPGSTVYYRISSVSNNGTVSAQSGFTMGTSLAQPVISDITGVSADSASVTWYMENASERSYISNLLYIVYCFSGGVETAQIMLEASEIRENRAVFNGLLSNTKYEYQVEAFLRSNQSAGEKSDRMDASTARNFRPGRPVNLKAARGTSVDKIELSFDLPDMVDIALGDNTYDPKPLYFTISKRPYSESDNNEYQLVCSYFGTNQASGDIFGGYYVPGDTVTWTDNSVIRGLTYEYLVQSYVDNTNRIISSDESRENATGWSLGHGEITYGTANYTLNNEKTLYTNAELPISFNFDPKGESYTYTVNAKIEPIEDDYQYNPGAEYIIESDHYTYNEIKNHVFEIDLTRKSAKATPGRGIYSVKIDVKLPGKTETIWTFEALGSRQISEDTKPIIVEDFHVQDGYKDRFVLVWKNHLNRKYTIEQSATGEAPWNEIGIVNPSPSDDDITVIDGYKYTVTGQTPGITRYFRVRPARAVSVDEFKSGQPVYAPAARTLGIPELSIDTAASYSKITPIWSEAQKADTYRIRYKYAEENVFTTAAQLKKEEFQVDANGRLKYSFSPEGYNSALKAGKEIQIIVDALNAGLQQENNSPEISTSSEVKKTNLVGTALLGVTASKAGSPQEITVSWNSVQGAGGYYIFRRQFNMDNTWEEGSESVVYYIPASVTSTINITGKNLATDASNSKIDTQTVKAAASFANSRYTLRDIYLPDNEYDSAYNSHNQAYRNQQNDIAQGWPYRYYVVPVIVRGGVPDSVNQIEFAYDKNAANKNTNIASYTLQENGAGIIYSGAAALEQEGFTFGFGQNVTATKGTYASSGKINDGIRITWSAPPRLISVAGFTPRYTLYRRITGGSSWVPVTSINNTTVYVDSPQERGVAYEYMVGIGSAEGSNVSQPQHSNRFLALCASQRDERDRPNMLGYMLDVVRMESVSRNELRDSKNNFAEEVRWYSAGISNSYDSQNFNWGIDGYEVFVMNRNISAGWHTIADMTGIPNQINLNVRVSNTAGGDTLQSGLLKVLRDYKHYFKVRSYVLKDNEKVYCPDPEWNYEILFAQAANRSNQDRANFLETDFVKWGARQIDHTEFAKIANLHIAWGIQGAAGSVRSGWTTRWSWIRWSDQGSNNGSGGRVGIETSFGVGQWWFNIQNFKPDFDTNANRNNFTYSVTFLTIDTGSQNSNKIIYADTNASSQFPQWYGRDGNYGSDFADIKGPSCVAPLYSGQLRYNSFSWTGGNVEVRYPAGSASVNITNSQANSPLPFQQQEPTGFGTDSRRYKTDAWY